MIPSQRSSEKPLIFLQFLMTTMFEQQRQDILQLWRKCGTTSLPVDISTRVSTKGGELSACSILHAHIILLPLDMSFGNTACGGVGVPVF